MSNIYENETYFLRINESLHDESHIPCYQIVNKTTDLVEAETTVLPTAIGHCMEFQAGLDAVAELRKKDEGPKIDYEH